ncbi:serine hydrolase [bacterium]|nr:serine hydrolase [bacterium]
MLHLQGWIHDADRLGRLIATVVIFLSVLTAGQAQAIPAKLTHGDLDRLVPRLMDGADIPGMSVVVLQHSRVSYVGNFGTMDRATNRPVERDTRFFAASLSKPLFAYAVLRLANRGLIDLDRPLCEYEENPRLKHDPRYREITARMVLSHTSGLPNWTSGAELELSFDPGSSWEYSGEGFVYLQQVVQRITGEDLQDFMQSEVFGPLRMRNSSYVADEQVQRKLAGGHDLLGRPTGQTLPSRRTMNPAGTLLTTAEDYGRFIEALLRREGIDNKLASQMSTAQARPTGFFGGENDSSVYWGLGFGIEAGRHGNNVWQWGDNLDYRSFVMVDPQLGSGIILLTNSANGLSVAERLAGTVLDGPHPAFDWLPYADFEDPRFIARHDLEHDFYENGGRGAERIYSAASRSLSAEQLTELVVSTGKHLVRDGLPKQAIALLQLHVQHNQSDPDAHDMLASFYLSTGSTEQALASLKQSARLDPDNRDRNATIARIERQL